MEPEVLMLGAWSFILRHAGKGPRSGPFARRNGGPGMEGRTLFSFALHLRSGAEHAYQQQPGISIS